MTVRVGGWNLQDGLINETEGVPLMRRPQFGERIVHEDLLQWK